MLWVAGWGSGPEPNELEKLWACGAAFDRLRIRSQGVAMQSYQIVEWGKPLERREAPTPEPRGTEVLLRVDACGVCHSDLHIWDGYFDLGGGNKATLDERGVKLPLTMGHEIVGRVVALGPDADGVAVGDRRVAYPWVGCRACAACDRGDDLMCGQAKYLGTRANGGYSDHVVVPHPKFLIDYGDLPTNLACTYACAGITAYSALKKAGPLTDKDDLLIIGAGGVGLSAVHIAPAVHPARIIVADVDATKRAAAAKAGAAVAIDNSEPDALKQVMEMTRGGVAAAIDFVGAPPTSRFGIDALHKGGTHVVVGLYGDALSVPLPLFPFKIMTVRGSFVGTLPEMHELMALVRAGKVPPLPVEPRPMTQANDTLEDLRAGRIVGRVVLNP